MVAASVADKAPCMVHTRAAKFMTLHLLHAFASVISKMHPTDYNSYLLSLCCSVATDIALIFG